MLLSALLKIQVPMLLNLLWRVLLLPVRVPMLLLLLWLCRGRLLLLPSRRL